MDPGFPRGGIERVFAQYDRITSHHPPDHEMHKDEPEAKKDPPHVPGDEPPWHSPEDKPVPATALPPDPLENGASGGFGKLVGSGLAIRAIQSQAQNSLRAALPELAEPLLGEAGAAVAEGAALGIADLAPGLALGAMTYAGLERAERNQYKNSAVEPGELTFEVDGKQVPAKTFHKPEATVSLAAVSFKGDE